MSDTNGIIIVKADGYEISFDRPIGYPDRRRDIRGFIDVHNWSSRVWRKALSLAGMEAEGITIYSLRHTYVSIAIANGADVKTFQKQLDHASATITLDTYAGLWPERLNEVANTVDKARTEIIVSDCV